MAVELEKIAKLLEDAYDRISALEQENERLQSGVSLPKEAKQDIFGDNDEPGDIFTMGHVAEIHSENGVSADARLDEFLAG
jgi:hypothetical protein